jgi:hypothetical protein
MKTYVRWAVCFLYLTVAAVCGAASFTPLPLNCSMFDTSLVLVTNLDKRMEVSVSGFSILPPQGENWCVKSLASQGLSFLKAPPSMAVFGQPSSPEELFPAALRAVRFSGLAVDLPDFGFKTESPEQLKVAVDAKVEARGFYKALGDNVVILKFINNLICVHPQPPSSKSPLIWISFVEVYREGEESAADTVRQEVDPYLQSLQFLPPR